MALQDLSGQLRPNGTGLQNARASCFKTGQTVYIYGIFTPTATGHNLQFFGGAPAPRGEVTVTGCSVYGSPIVGTIASNGQIEFDIQKSGEPCRFAAIYIAG